MENRAGTGGSGAVSIRTIPVNASTARHRKSVIPWVLAICVCMGIIATVLLSRDMKNLRALFDFYGMQWPFETVAKATERPPVIRKHRRIPAARILLEPRLMAHALRDEPAMFTRIMPQDGPGLCAAIAASGMPMEGAAWGEDPYDRALSGCRSIIAHEVDDGASSLFIDVKGRSSGQVLLVRMKLVLAEGTGGTALREKAGELFSLVTSRSGWSDFTARAAAIPRLEEFSLSASGLNVSMIREPSGRASYNIFVQQAGKARGQMRVRQYFDDTGTLPAAPWSTMRLAKPASDALPRARLVHSAKAGGKEP